MSVRKTNYALSLNEDDHVDKKYQPYYVRYAKIDRQLVVSSIIIIAQYYFFFARLACCISYSISRSVK